MKLFIENCNGNLWFCLNAIRWVGFLVPDELTGIKKKLYPLYVVFSFMFIVGIYVITQIGCLVQVWGDMSDMTNASFLLFINFGVIVKTFNVMLRSSKIQALIDEGDEELKNEKRPEGLVIVQECNMDNRYILYIYGFVSMVTVFGWIILAFIDHELPLKAWYPYDTTKSPAYEITYTHQSIAVVIIGVIDPCLDQMVTSLISVCRARLKLVNLSLRTLCQGIDLTDKNLTDEQEAQVFTRLRKCAIKHQAALQAALQIENCFSISICSQFIVSVFIMCVTSYQLAIEKDNSFMRLVSMTTYLMCITFQVYLYCYQGNHLTDECMEVSDAAYESPWYLYSTSLRRTLLIMMVRSQAVVKITAGGFTHVTLDSFVSIIKASYSLFAVLQKMEE